MEGEGGIITFIFTGVYGEDIPRDATRVIIHESVSVIPSLVFRRHPNVVEVICHDGVKEIEPFVFDSCPRLKRVIMPGVKVIGEWAFFNTALTYVECGKLEVIGENAFCRCESLTEINLPSIIVVRTSAFLKCQSITKVTFGKKIESIRFEAFHGCSSLERITVPLKDNILAYDVFDTECTNLKCINLIDEEMLHETAAALLRDEWRDDMKAEMNSIKQILSRYNDRYEKEDISLEIQEWISTVRLKIFCYKKQHIRVLKKATITIEEVFPRDIVMNNVVPFLELPSHTFEGEDDDSSFEASEEEDEDDLGEGRSEDNEGEEDEEGGSNNEESSSSDGSNEDGRKRRRMAND